MVADELTAGGLALNSQHSTLNPLAPAQCSPGRRAGAREGGLSSGADKIPDQARVSARINHGRDDRPLRFDEIINREITLGDERTTVVVEFKREALGISSDPIRSREVAFQKLVTAARPAGGEVVIRRLDVFADNVECDDGLAFHVRRRIDRFSSGIVKVGIWPPS